MIDPNIYNTPINPIDAAVPQDRNTSNEECCEIPGSVNTITGYSSFSGSQAIPTDELSLNIPVHGNAVCPTQAVMVGVIPDLQCKLDEFAAFTTYWDNVSLCDPDTPYLPESDWYVAPEVTGINCT